MTLSAWWIKQETKHRDWKTWTQTSRRKSRSWRYKNSRTLALERFCPLILRCMSICRMRRTSCVMRNKSWRLRKTESSSNSKRSTRSLVSYQTRQHCLRLKLLEVSLSLSQLTLALPCGSSCHLLQLIPHRTMSFVLRLLKRAASTIDGSPFLM